MGCGITTQKFKTVEISNLPPWKCTKLSIDFNFSFIFHLGQSLYIFARENKNKNTIMKFDANNEEWQILPSPNNVKIIDHSCGVMADDEIVIVTGGMRDPSNKKEEHKVKSLKELESQNMDDDQSDAEDNCFLFSTRLNRFFNFPSLNIGRYWHMMVSFKNSVYVLGGKTKENSDTSIISSVEKFNLEQIKEQLLCLDYKKNEPLTINTKWSEVEPFTKPRFKGNAFVFNENIFLIGGLTNNNKTCRYIEKYHGGNNQWSFLKWKLPFAIHSSSLTALNHNELIMIGGRNDAGLVSSIYQIDIIKGRYKSRRGFSLREYPKILHFNDNIYIFGGDDQKTCERFNPIEFISLSSNESYTSLLDSDLIKFSCSPPSVTIGNSSPEEPDFEELFDNSINLSIKSQNSSEKNYLLGSPSLPFFLEFDGSYESVTYLSVSVNFRFYYFSVARKINHLYMITMGGVTPPFRKASKNTQILNLTNFSSKKCTKMLEGRIKFDGVILNSNKVIVSGGQTYVNQKDKFLKTAEEYDIINDNWKPLAEMNLARYNHCLHVYKGNVYAYGGSDGENILNSIEEYNVVANIWKLCDLKLHEPLVSFTLTPINKNEVIIIGGNNGKMNMNIVASINMEKKTCNVLGGIKQPRCQHKTIYYQEDLIILGGIGADNMNIDVIRVNNLNHKTEIYGNLEKSIKKFYSDKTLLGIPIC